MVAHETTLAGKTRYHFEFFSLKCYHNLFKLSMDVHDLDYPISPISACVSRYRGRMHDYVCMVCNNDFVPIEIENLSVQKCNP
jgi:hypothetical protein